MGATLRAAVYARLSRPKDTAELGVNIEDQESIGRAVVAHRGWRLVDVFTDNGRGAYQDNVERPAWERMLAARPDVIIVRDEERLARHMKEYVALLGTKARVVAWLDVETAEADLEAPLQNTDTDEFAQKIVGARSYSRKIGSKVKRKVKMKAAAGAWPHGGTRPFGYHHSCCRDEQGRVACAPGTVRPEEAEVIREVADRWLGGETLMSLCRDLDRRGVRTPADKAWQYARLRAMLAGPRIAGIRTHHGVETRGQWEAIVSADLHARLVSAASESLSRRANENGTYLLSGIVWCACGSKMYGLTQRAQAGPRVRYVCRGPEGCQLGIAGPATDEFVFNRAFMSILAPEMRNAEESRRDLDGARATVADLRARIADLDAEYWERRSMSKERWVGVSERLAAELVEAKAREADVKQRLSRLRDAPTTAEALSRRWQAADTRERNRLLRVGVERVVVHPRPAGKGRFDPTRIELRLRDGQVLRLAAADVLTPAEERARLS